MVTEILFGYHGGILTRRIRIQIGAAAFGLALAGIPCFAEEGETVATPNTRMPAYLRLLPGSTAPTSGAWRMPTQHERFEQYLNSTFSPKAMVYSGIAAGIRMANGTPREWEGGMEGYGMRFSNSYGRTIIRGTIRYGMAAMLNEDIRSYRMPQESAGKRLVHVLITPVTSKNSAGHRQFSTSKVVAGVGANAIARTWLPPSEQGVGQIAISCGMWYTYDVLWGLGREFLPDLFRKKK
jgi:hypothetical protein